MRLIDADALKNALIPLEATGGHKYYRAGMDTVLHKFMPKFIDDAPTIEAAPVVHGRWIPVSEKLPKESGFYFEDMGKAVLVYTPVDGCMHVGWYTGKDWGGRDTWNTLSVMRSVQSCKKKVTHWMPLPNPPKEVL